MESNTKVRLAENLKRLLFLKRLTIPSVARKIGMNQSTLHNYCNGVAPRNLSKIKELADLLEVSLGELIFGPNSDPVGMDSNEGPEGRFEVTVRRIDRLIKIETKK